MNKLDLTGKTAFVTGSSRGIGLATSKLLKERGADVIATARGEQDVKRLKDIGFTSYQLDVSNKDNIDEFFKANKALNIDILVNNAGSSALQLLPKTSYEEWQRILNTNLTSSFLIAKYLLPHMRKNKWGRVVNISSVLASYPQKGFSAYSASKAGIEGLTRTLALEYASKGITINSVAPGFTDTEMLDTILAGSGRETHQSAIPVGFVGQPEDIAESVAFLASEAARYITGEVLNISGGLKF